MGLVARLKQVTVARIEAFLDAAEDPSLIVPQLIKEVGAQLHSLKMAEAKALAAVKSSQRKLDEVCGRITRLERGAEMALRLGDENTAREALEVQVRLGREKRSRAVVLQKAEQAYEDASRMRVRMVDVQDHLKGRRSELRSHASKGAVLHAKAKAGKSILDAVARVEARLDDDENDQNRNEELVAASLERRLRQMERQSEIEKRLAILKVQGTQPGTDSESENQQQE